MHKRMQYNTNSCLLVLKGVVNAITFINVNSCPDKTRFITKTSIQGATTFCKRFTMYQHKLKSW